MKPPNIPQTHTTLNVANTPIHYLSVPSLVGNIDAALLIDIK